MNDTPDKNSSSLRPRPGEASFDLEDFNSALRRESLAELKAYGPVPDFAAVLARAQELEPEEIDDADVRASRAQQDELGQLSNLGQAYAELDTFTEPLRAEIESGIEDEGANLPRTSAPRPARHQPTITSVRRSNQGPNPRAASRWVWTSAWLGGLAAAAAAVIFLRPTGALLGESTLAQDGELAPRVAVEGESQAALQARRRRPQAAGTAGTQTPVEDSGELVPVPAPEQLPEPVLEPELESDNPPEAAEPQVEEVPTKAKKRRQKTRARDLDLELARAQKLWREGQLQDATELLESIARRGGRSKAAESAFADLFSLTPRVRDQRALEKLWRRYLKRFPRGRFADDARAGLCNVPGSRSDCWLDYLKHHPNGAYRRQAERELASGAGRD